MALFVLAFALLLPGARKAGATRSRSACSPPGSSTSTRSPGLAWLGGVAVVWGAIELSRGRAARVAAAVLAERCSAVARRRRCAGPRRCPELDRLRDFADFRALHPDRANEGGLGNLPGQLSPLEALGIWPTSEFRLSAARSSLPGARLLRRRRCSPLVAFAARPAALDPPPRRRDPGRAARRRRPLPARPRLRHRLHLGQGARDRRPPRSP